jgi:hypothetical protein
MNFLNFFQFLWVIFTLLVPDTGSTDLTETGSGSETLVAALFAFKVKGRKGLIYYCIVFGIVE